MRTISFVLCFAAVSLFCGVGPAEFQRDVRAAAAPKRGIVFNGGFNAGRQKWQGPYHNKLLFPWFTAYTSAADPQEYRKVIDQQRRNGVEFLGYYYSATTSYALEPAGHHARFPERAIPPEAMKASWVLRDSNGQPVTWPGESDRYFLDVGANEVREELLSRVIGNATELGVNALFLDNWYHKYWAPGDLNEPLWTGKCLTFLIRARELTQQSNLRLVVNTPSPPENWLGFAQYVDGIAYELAAHPNRFRTRAMYERELSSYEQVLAAGKSVFLYTDRLEHNGLRWDEDGRKVAATAMLVMPKDQPNWGGVYVCPPRYEVWPVGGWAMWPEQLGQPLGIRKWQDTTVSREFEHGSISVEIGEKPQFSINLKY